jgi:mRNA interferase MazF
MKTEIKQPRFGEIWWVDLEPVRGREQGKQRPCLVVSGDQFNQSNRELVWILPITKNLKPHTLKIQLASGQGGLKQPSAVLCYQLRTVANERFDNLLGHLESTVMEEVMLRLQFILGIV